MKKFWEKHSLVKLALVMILFTVLLTWIIPQGQFSSTEIVVGEITRVGIFDFFTYLLYSVYYWPVLITLILVIGAFYQVLSKTGGYKKLINSIAKAFKKREILFVLLTSFIIALLTAVLNDYFVLLVFIPFIIAILSKMKLDKMTGLVTTFGSILVGTIGSIYSNKIVGVNISSLGLENGTYLWVKLALFASAFIIFNIFNVLHIKKTLKDKKAELTEDIFVSEEVTKKNKVWPVVTILILFLIVSIIAYLPWTSFGIDVFDKLHQSIHEFEIFGSPIFSYILGSPNSFAMNQYQPGSFGNWDLFGIQTMMVIATLILKFAYKIKWDEFFTAYGEGFKKVGNIILILLLTYTILIIPVMSPVLPTIIDWLMSITSKFNVVLGTFAGLISSLFTVEYHYTVGLIGNYFVVTYSDFAKELPIMLQATYGLVSFFTPASAILIVGLSYLGISYKDWFKYIWKFLIAMLVIIVVLMLIIF